MQTCEEKCVPFVPSTDRDVRDALYFAKLQPGEIFLELGCGDGKNLRIATQEFDAVGIGYEIDPDLVRKARENTYGLPVTIHHASFLNASSDVARSDVVYVYLLQTVNQIIRPMLEQNLKTDARVVSLVYTFDGWTPTTTHGNLHFYFSHPPQSSQALAGQDRVRDVISRYKPELKRKGAKVVCMDETDRGLGIYIVTEAGTAIPSEIEGVPVEVKYLSLDCSNSLDSLHCL